MLFFFYMDVLHYKSKECLFCFKGPVSDSLSALLLLQCLKICFQKLFCLMTIECDSKHYYTNNYYFLLFFNSFFYKKSLEVKQSPVKHSK